MVQTGEHRFILLILIKAGVLSAGPSQVLQRLQRLRDGLCPAETTI